MAACGVLGIGQIFSSYNNPKGNADTERVFRTMKEDLIWLREWASYEQLKTAIGKWVWEYNHLYPHQTLKNIPPVAYEEKYYENHINNKQILPNFQLT